MEELGKGCTVFLLYADQDGQPEQINERDEDENCNIPPRSLSPVEGDLENVSLVDQHKAEIAGLKCLLMKVNNPAKKRRDKDGTSIPVNYMLNTGTSDC